MPEPVPGDKGGHLARRLGAFDSTMMLVGIVIGSGIFLTTGIMADSLPSGGLILVAWLVGGLLALAGALTYAELGTMMPEAGGQYVYLREAYGPACAFLFGWVLFLVSMTGSIAALAVAFVTYLGHFVPGTEDGWGTLVAVGVIIAISAINYVGVAPGKTVQNLLTAIKIGTLLAFVALGMVSSGARPPELSWNPTGASLGELLIGFGVALIAVSWAFDGWHNLNYAAGEIRNPRRNLPLALIVGTGLITVLYLLVNAVYLMAIPLEELPGVERVAERAASGLWGKEAAGLVSAAVMISVLGALNGAIFVGPRVYWAMARDGVFFRRVAEVHPRYRTPGVAIVIQAAWSILLALTGSFESLLTFVMFATFLFWIAAAASVFTLRRKLPEMDRPYRTWGYPFVPGLFILAMTGILVNTLIERPVESLAGVALMVLGVPVYHLWRHRST